MRLRKTEPAPQDVAEMLRDGSYYAEARAWYNTVYLNPLSERYLAILMLILASATLLFALTAVQNLLPLNDEVPYYFSLPDGDAQKLYMQPLRAVPTESLDVSLRRYLVSEYIRRYESYEKEPKTPGVAYFVREYSEGGLWEAYLSQPEPQTRFGAATRREIALQRLLIQPDPNIPGMWNAQGSFTATLIGRTQRVTSRWTVSLSFSYSDATLHTNAETGQKTMSMPQFTVMEYERTLQP